MTKGALLFAIAAWAVKYGNKIKLDTWDLARTGMHIELMDILEKANCEHIYVNSEKVMPNAEMNIIVPYNLRLANAKWEGNNLVLHYEERSV